GEINLFTINTAILTRFLFAVILLSFNRQLKRLQHLHVGWIILPVPAVLFFLLLGKVPIIKNCDTVFHKRDSTPSFNLTVSSCLDGLSMIFGLLITGIGTLVILYSIYYLSTEQALIHFYIYILLFMGSMLGIVFSDHTIILYVFWELTSIS